MSTWTRVGIALIPRRDGKVLMARRLPDALRPGMWELPGGKALDGEGVVSAALREVGEELGVCGDPASAVCLGSCEFDLEIRIRVFLVAVDIGEQEPRPLASSEVRWVDPLDAVKNLPCVPSTYVLYPSIKRYMESKPWLKPSP